MKSKKVNLIFNIALLLISIALIQSCTSHHFRSNYKSTNSLLHATDAVSIKPFLKAHLKNGDICILEDSWKVDATQEHVTGAGSRYDFNRALVYYGEISLAIDSVAIFETNKKLVDPEFNRITGLTILTSIDVLLGAFCLTNPKACFGSCPTFYLNKTDDFHYADAEGFSNAISPSMEYADIDALRKLTIEGDSFSITMKNEALETHCVNNVKLLAYPTSKNERVFQSPSNQFYLCKNDYAVSNAKAEEGDVTALLQDADKQERFSLSDKKNLSSKEEILLTFDNVENPNNLGMRISFRQTLLTTYLFYSAMGYMGDQVGDIFATLETDEKKRNNFDGTTKELGNIDIYLWSDKRQDWELQHGFNETGPIAINSQFIPLKHISSNPTVKLKIVLNKGLWRIDNLALTNIIEQVTPLEIDPHKISNKGVIDMTALAEIENPDKHLISMPGSEYTFDFKLPQSNQTFELFLYSKGYYLEWMRKHWIKDKNMLKLKQMVDYPKAYLKSEAKAFKQYEKSMEEQFWNSRIDTKTFSYYED
jgi:hypothetical protein